VRSRPATAWAPRPTPTGDTTLRQRKGTRHDQDDPADRAQRAVRPHLHPPAARPGRRAGGHRHLPRPPDRPRDHPRAAARRRACHPQRGGRVTPAVIDDIAYLGFLAEQLFAGQVAVDRLFEVAVVHHTQCGTGFLADPAFRHQAAEATGLNEAALEASAVADPQVTVKADVERLLTSPLLSPKVSVSGHVYDIATGLVTTTVDARYP